ncbi:MAG: hypothetical protein HQK58_12510 [Deltaproteobacteria bacterium]|nr:hypothetical protein [Deltaproteobacteria bacterium]
MPASSFDHEPRYVNLSLTEVDQTDRTFVISFGRETPVTQAVVRAAGTLPPVHLRTRVNAPHQVVIGFERIAAYRQLEVNSFPALLWPAALPDCDALVMATANHALGSVFNEAERALLLAKLSIHVEPSRLIADVLPMLGLNPNPEILRRYLTLADLEEIFILALAKGKLNRENALSLAKLNPPDRLALFNVISALGYNHNTQRELIENINTLSRRETQTGHDLITSPDSISILDDSRIDQPTKAERWRRWIKNKLFPRLTLAEETYHRLTAPIRSLSQVILKPPPFFEGNKWTISFSFENQPGLTGTLAALTKADETGLFGKLLAGSFLESSSLSGQTESDDSESMTPGTIREGEGASDSLVE